MGSIWILHLCLPSAWYVATACHYALSLSMSWKAGVWIKWNSESKTLAPCLACCGWSIMTKNVIIINNLFYYNRLVIAILTLCCCVSRSIVSDSLWPHVPQPSRLPCPWDSPSKNIPFSGGSAQPRGQTQAYPYCRQILYHLSHKGSPLMLQTTV